MDTTAADLREAFLIATAGNWRDYPQYVDKILDQLLALEDVAA